MGDVSIAVELREGRGKGPARRLRMQGRVPAVVYGHGKEPIAVSVDPVGLDRKIKASHAGMNTLFELEGAPSVKGRTVLLKDLQREPVRGAILHADFFELDMKERINVQVPVHLSGEAAGTVFGGLVEHSLREVELSCLPGAIPDELIAPIDALEIGMSLHVRDLVLPEGVEMVTDEELSVVSVMAPRTEELEAKEEEAAVAAAAAASEAEGEKQTEGED